MELTIFTSVCLICVTWVATIMIKLDHQKKYSGRTNDCLIYVTDKIIKALNEIYSGSQAGDKQNPETDGKN